MSLQYEATSSRNAWDGPRQCLAVEDTRNVSPKDLKRLKEQAERERRAKAIETQRIQARAVLEKRNRILSRSKGKDIEWAGTLQPHLRPSTSG